MHKLTNWHHFKLTRWDVDSLTACWQYGLDSMLAIWTWTVHMMTQKAKRAWCTSWQTGTISSWQDETLTVWQHVGKLASNRYTRKHKWHVWYESYGRFGCKIDFDLWKPSILDGTNLQISLLTKTSRPHGFAKLVLLPWNLKQNKYMNPNLVLPANWQQLALKINLWSQWTEKIFLYNILFGCPLKFKYILPERNDTKIKELSEDHRSWVPKEEHFQNHKYLFLSKCTNLNKQTFLIKYITFFSVIGSALRGEYI